MTAQYPTLAERHRAAAMERSFSIEAAKGLRSDAQTALSDLVRGFGKLREAGADIAYLDDAIRGLLDEASNLQAGIDRALDGADPFAPELDVSELHALLKKVRS